MLAAVVLAASVPSCSPSWQAGPQVVADPSAVARALGDPPPPRALATGDLPELAPPHHPRNCCVLGMDMQVDLAGVRVPFLEVGNVIEVGDLGRHIYDLPDGVLDGEPNGLVYTCRGGWVDTAHVQDNADVFVFVALALAAHLREGTTLTLPDHGAPTTITLAPVDERQIARVGSLAIAMDLAAWVTYRIGIWHEVATWFGYESVPGFSERVSAFSPEDLYSNALGIHLARAVLEQRAFLDRDEYERTFAAFLVEALQRLDAQPRPTARAIMASLDGLWWTSTEQIPDNHLVRRRRFPPAGDEIRPWRAEDAFEPASIPEPITRACRGAETRPLSLVTRILGDDPRDHVVVTWVPEGWADGHLPMLDPERRVVDERELERLVAQAHDEMAADLGPDLDVPRSAPIAPLEARAPAADGGPVLAR